MTSEKCRLLILVEVEGGTGPWSGSVHPKLRADRAGHYACRSREQVTEYSEAKSHCCLYGRSR